MPGVFCWVKLKDKYIKRAVSGVGYSIYIWLINQPKLCYGVGVKKHITRQKGAKMAEKERKKHKNTVKGSQRGRKYAPELVERCLIDYIIYDNVIEVAKKNNVPESTLRGWKARAEQSGDYQGLKEKIKGQITEQALKSAKIQFDYLAHRSRAQAEDWQKVHGYEREILAAIEAGEMERAQAVADKLQAIKSVAHPLDLFQAQGLYQLFYLHSDTETAKEAQAAQEVIVKLYE